MKMTQMNDLIERRGKSAGGMVNSRVQTFNEPINIESTKPLNSETLSGDTKSQVLSGAFRIFKLVSPSRFAVCKKNHHPKLNGTEK